MSVPFEGLLDGCYQLENTYAGVERLVNWYLIANEYPASEKKFTFVSNPFPGNKQFSDLPMNAPFNQPNRGLIENRGKVFGVNGDVCFELFADGTYNNLGTVVNDGKMCSMPANGTGQVFIASGGQGYVIDATGTFHSIPIGDFLGASYATFQDGYILTVVPDSNKNQISGDDSTPTGDALVWSAANVIVQAGQADLQSAIISSREYVRLLGQRRSQVYQNVGNNGIGGFPFQSYNETFIETGIAAPFSLSDLGDSLIWVGQDQRGVRACWRDSAFQPQRVSTLAIEWRWAQYSDISDAVAFSYIWNGHLFYQITFPSASVDGLGNKTAATWVYDVTVSQLVGRHIWMERTFTNEYGVGIGRAEVSHCFAFGKHLVGSNGTDGNPGAIYALSGAQFWDEGINLAGDPVHAPIVCDRITPHIYGVDQNVVYNRITLELARGVGLDVPDGDPGYDPQILLRWSDDGGKTFGTEYSLSIGKQGEYVKRVFLNRLGYAPRGGGGRVFWLRCTDPTFNSLISAQLDMFGCAP